MTQHKLKDIDSTQVNRVVYNEKDGALNVNKINSLVPSAYGKVVLTYTTIASEDVIDTATFYGDGESQVTQIRSYADVAGSLNNKYFFIWSANDVTKYYVWFNNGTGVDPAPPAATGIVVNYLNDDAKSIIATKTAIAINAIADFAAESHADSILVTNVTHGNCTDAVDNNSGFKFYKLRAGTDREIVVILQMSYAGSANLTSAERVFYG